MISGTLFKREIKGSIKLLFILAAPLTLYISVIISMYEPELAELLDSYVELLPGIMSAVGMTAGATNLLDFMVSYLYGFILLLFIMLFCILRGNGLIAKYVDKGSMVSLLTAPVKRSTVAFTQMIVLISDVVILVIYCTMLELVCANHFFPDQLDVANLIILNAGLLCLHILIAGICFFFSCIFSDTKYSLGFGAGIPLFMLLVQMISNMGGTAEKAKYFTFFTLFNPDGIVARECGSIIGIIILLLCGIVLFTLGIAAFSKKDLHI